MSLSRRLKQNWVKTWRHHPQPNLRLKLHPQLLLKSLRLRHHHFIGNWISSSLWDYSETVANAVLAETMSTRRADNCSSSKYWTVAVSCWTSLLVSSDPNQIRCTVPVIACISLLYCPAFQGLFSSSFRTIIFSCARIVANSRMDYRPEGIFTPFGHSLWLLHCVRQTIHFCNLNLV